MQRKGKIHSAFFSDLTHGGRELALAAAMAHYQEMKSRLGPPPQANRRAWAQVRRRKSASGIVGVQKVMRKYNGRVLKAWVATWSPEPGVVRRMMFSIRKYGAIDAKQLAILARRRGVREMK